MQELEELLNLLGDDAATVRAALDKHPDAKQRVAGAETVFRAFVDGDQTALDNYTRNNPPVARPAATDSPARLTAAPATPALDMTALLDQLEQRLDKRYIPADKFEERATQTAESLLTKKQGDLIGSAMKGADEIYTIRASHREEFGSQLDGAKFEEFLKANTGKFASITDAYNAMVSDARTEAKIAKGIAEGRAALETTNVPGTSLPTSATPLGMMLRANKDANAVGRGEHLDKAAAAFRSLQTQRVN
jgi:hypothetical protein